MIMIVLHRYEWQAQTLQATTLLQEDDRTEKWQINDNIDNTNARAQETGVDREHRRKEGKRKIFSTVIADLWLVDSSIAIGHDEYKLSTVKDHLYK